FLSALAAASRKHVGHISETPMEQSADRNRSFRGNRGLTLGKHKWRRVYAPSPFLCSWLRVLRQNNWRYCTLLFQCDSSSPNQGVRIEKGQPDGLGQGFVSSRLKSSKHAE